jgi:hypothetical protein
MRRKMRKPATMRTRTYVAHINRMNMEELPLLPPNAQLQFLPLEEIKDIIIYGLPKSWVRKMDEFDFDPYTQELGHVINFCERMESAEQHDASSKTVKSDYKSTKKSKTSKYTKTSSRKGEGNKWCDYHESSTHDTADCATLKKLKAQGDGGGKPAYSKNKTWKRKSDDASKFSKKELSSIAKKAGVKAVKAAKKKQLYLMAAKRKMDESSESSSSAQDEDSDMESVASVHMLEESMEEIDRQLADFDFAKNKTNGDKSDGEVSC